jgi:hypothetical protein
VSTVTQTTTAHQSWCDDKDDDQPVHECGASLSVELSTYEPRGDLQPNVGALLSRHNGEGAPYIEVSIDHGEDGAAADLTVAEAAQLGAALSSLAARASAPQ